MHFRLTAIPRSNILARRKTVHHFRLHSKAAESKPYSSYISVFDSFKVQQLA
jgi:hypothetical protein